MKKSYLLALALMAGSINVYASNGEIQGKVPSQSSNPKIVRWIGEISDSKSEHTTLTFPPKFGSLHLSSPF